MKRTVEDRLLHLVDRAARRLGADEGELLRAGVRAMATQLQQAQQDLALTAPYRVRCSYCKADVGDRCRAMRGLVPPRTPHTARLTAAAKGVTA